MRPSADRREEPDQLLCIVNISEGRDPDVLAALDAACGADLLDRHSDPHHHRSVFSLVGEHAPRRLAAVAFEKLDLTAHSGAHPRLGVVDVVPFVPWGKETMAEATSARDRFAAWAGDRDVPAFVYAAERTLPDLRRQAFDELTPRFGPSAPHRRAGAVAVGARRPLVAYNLWVDADLATARQVARSMRGPAVRALGLQVGARVQVSMNLVAPAIAGPAAVFDTVSSEIAVEGAELVGLMPADVLNAIDPDRWAALDIGPDRTIEARMASRTPTAAQPNG
jgi:glutamate formiminotransferase